MPLHGFAPGFSAGNLRLEARQIRRPEGPRLGISWQRPEDTDNKKYAQKGHPKLSGPPQCWHRHGAPLKGSMLMFAHSRGVSMGCQWSAHTAGRKKLQIIARFRMRRFLGKPHKSWTMPAIFPSPNARKAFRGSGLRRTTSMGISHL
jgi:hypothetical protein